jgi:hypothetical protein
MKLAKLILKFWEEVNWQKRNIRIHSFCFLKLTSLYKYFCGGFICKGVHFVLFNFDETHEVVSLIGNFIWSTVFKNDFADLVVIDVDDRRYSCQWRKSWAVYHCDVRLVWVRDPVELGWNDAGGHGRNCGLLRGGNGIHLFVGKFDLSCIDIVD